MQVRYRLHHHTCDISPNNFWKLSFQEASAWDVLSLILLLQSEKYGAEGGWKECFSFFVETVENAVKSWHETSKVDPRVYFLLNKEKTDTEKYAPAVNIDKVLKLLPKFLLTHVFPTISAFSNMSELNLWDVGYITLSSAVGYSIFYLIVYFYSCARLLSHPIRTAVVLHFFDSMLKILSPQLRV